MLLAFLVLAQKIKDHFEKDLDQDHFQIISKKKGSRSRSFSDHLREKDLDQDHFQIISKKRIYVGQDPF